jgi:alpha-glucosidase
MEFLSTNEDVLAFTRSRGDDRLLFVFNLRRGPQEMVLPKGHKGHDVLAMPGLAGTLDAGEIRLGPLDGICVRLT